MIHADKFKIVQGQFRIDKIAALTKNIQGQSQIFKKKSFRVRVRCQS